MAGEQKPMGEMEQYAESVIPEMEKLTVEEMAPVMDFIETHFKKGGYRHICRRLRNVYKAKKAEAAAE